MKMQFHTVIKNSKDLDKLIENQILLHKIRERFEVAGNHDPYLWDRLATLKTLLELNELSIEWDDAPNTFQVFITFPK